MLCCKKAQTVLLIVLILVNVLLGIGIVVTRPVHQSSNVPSHGTQIPPTGKYYAQSSILGSTVKVTIDVLQTSSTTGIFDFQMTSPLVIDCGMENSFGISPTSGQIQFTLGPCAIQKLDQYGVDITSITYSTTTKILTAQMLFANLIPITLSLQNIGPLDLPEICASITKTLRLGS